MNVTKILAGKKEDKLFLLGNEAAVRGALEGGVSFVSTYPGTPSSEIGDVFSKLAREAGVYFEYSTNEKVAVEVSAAAAAAGLRSFVFMKHVGLNVAADSFMSTAYLGVKKGMIILTADDPSMYSSQNEQDNRIYARIAGIPLLEPADPQEVKDLMKFGFELSEQIHLPVLMRTTTRVSHMRGIVHLNDVIPPEGKGFFEKAPSRYVPVPANAVRMRKELLDKLAKAEKIADSTQVNKVYDFGDEFGIITSGGAFNYVMDVVKENNIPAKILKLAFTYPFPQQLVKEFLFTAKNVLIVEEVEPVMEKEVLAIAGKYKIPVDVYGKLTDTLPRIYEYSPDIVKNGIKKISEHTIKKRRYLKTDITLPIRPPILCAGCPHRATYFAVKEAIKKLKLKDVIFPTDIGCYTLGIQPPYEMADYLLSMGSSIGTGTGFSYATDQKIVSFIGDSTFFHAGLPGLVNAVHNKANLLIVVMDNRTTAMTGRQPSPSEPVNGMGETAPEISIENSAKGIGVEFVKTVDPYSLAKAKEVFEEALKHDGVSVVISKHPCALITDTGRKKKNLLMTFTINQDKCTKCMVCVKDWTCPAFYVGKDDTVHIDPLICDGCGVCVQVCPGKAIEVRK